MVVNDEHYILCFCWGVDGFDTFLNSFKLKKVDPKQFAFIKFNSLQKKILYEKKKLNDDFYLIADTLDVDFE